MNPEKLIPYIDLTSLNDNDDELSVLQLCKNASTAHGDVAAICVYDKFISVVAKFLEQYNKLNKIKIATVVNFPTGLADISTVLEQTNNAINLGANEIDLVYPYSLFTTDRQVGWNMVHQAKLLCKHHNVTLKVIIESGLLSSEIIGNITSQLLELEVDFIKTSTGKVKIGATQGAATTILKLINASSHKCGLKVSGGIKTINDAVLYYNLAAEIMGEAWVTSDHFRIGASSLLTEILKQAV